MSNEFFFYDYECFGIDPALDLIAQFAGIRTDADFNPIGEPIELLCRPANDYLPSPEAIMVNGLTPDYCLKHGISEPEFAHRILQAFGKNTCILGYNNLRFDDEFTRYLFYRNFISPYAYSYLNGNSRWDLIDLVRACYALRPEGFNWPKNNQDKVSFSLENLSRENNLTHEKPHDALSDVFSTIALAKFIKEKQPKIFNYYFTNRKKEPLRNLINTIMYPAQATTRPPIMVHVSRMFEVTEHHCLNLVFPLGWHPNRKDVLITIKLNEEIEDLLHLSVELLHERIYTSHEELRKNNLSPIPLKLVNLSRCPFLAPISVLLPENIERLKLDLPTCLQKAEKIKQNQQNLNQKLQHLYSIPRKPLPENSPYLNVECRLYDSFIKPDDEKKFPEILNAKAEDLAKLIFIDPRLNQLLFNYRSRYFNHSLSKEEQEIWQKKRSQKLAQQADSFWQKINDLKENKNYDQLKKQQILEKLTNYAHTILAGQLNST